MINNFIAKSEDNKLLPVQVCLELTEDISEREIRGVVEACHWLGVSKGMILTFDEENELSVEGINIRVLPVWKWCIEAFV